MNDLQKVELELLRQFVEICEKLELNYYLVCGSALGAVKYQGFIPWDDDVDVALPRGDYERFLREAPALLPEHVFLQNYRTDPGFPQIFSKLRHCGTTYIEKSVAKLPINHGICIDIFPLDGRPEGAAAQRLLELRKKLFLWQLMTAVDLPRGPKSMAHYTVFRLMGCHRRIPEIAARYERMISAYPAEGAKVWCNHGNWQGVLDYAPAEQFGEGARAVFEGLQVRIPVQYDAYLRQKYGDYRRDLPEDQKVGHHYYEICDTEKPYTDYIGSESGKT